MGKTILFVSHDLGSISKYCDRVVLLNKGIKMAEGRPKRIVDMYKQILVNKDAEVVEQGTQRELADVQAAQASGEWKANMELNPDLLDYGEKQAEIVDFAVIDDQGVINSGVVKGKEFQIRMKVRFHRDIQDPIFAFTIKDTQGTEITGTNTMYENISCGPVKKGEERVATFTQRMTLQGKSYLLSLGCVGFSNNKFTVYHRLYDVCNIDVISDKNTVGFYDMESAVEIR